MTNNNNTSLIIPLLLYWWRVNNTQHFHPVEMLWCVVILHTYTCRWDIVLYNRILFKWRSSPCFASCRSSTNCCTYSAITHFWRSNILGPPIDPCGWIYLHFVAHYPMSRWAMHDANNSHVTATGSTVVCGSYFSHKNDRADIHEKYKCQNWALVGTALMKHIPFMVEVAPSLNELWLWYTLRWFVHTIGHVFCNKIKYIVHNI